MKVLVLEDIASSTFGGAERSMRAFCERLARDGHEVHLVFDRPGDYSLNADGFYTSVTRISTLPFRAQRALAWIAAINQLVRLCRSRNIELILTHVVHAFPILRVVRMLAPVRVSVYFKWVCTTDTVGKQASWGLKGLDDGAAVSEFVADYWIRNGFPKRRMRVIPEGLLVDSSSDTASFHLMRHETGEPFRVGFAGRIVPEKGLDVLFRAVAELVNDGMDIHCTVAGEFDPEASEYHSSLVSLTNSLDIARHVHFAGYVNALGEMLKQMQVVVVPSLCQDAQPLVLMQSMSLGIPPIASRVGGIPEMLCEDLSALMFDAGDVNALAELIRSIRDMPAADLRILSVRLRARVQSRYSLEKSQWHLSRALGIN
jgi:glycosyltransferase involved in cell wall biosynthesis